MTTNPADAGNAGHVPGHGPEPTIEEILRAAHPEGPFTVADMVRTTNPGFESDEEIDEFILAVREWRNESLA
jgi:hypothetical protein